MDRPIEEWKPRFRGMEPKALNKTWASRADDDMSWVHECNFHAAVADRLKQIGNLAIDIDDDARQKLCMQANSIVSRLQNHLRNEPAKLTTIQESIAASDEYFAKYGTKTARYYMYEQGVIDELGDRLMGR